MIHVATHTKASQIKDPILWALHKWLSGSIHGRKKSDWVVTCKDAYLIHDMLKGYLCDVVYMYVQTCMDAGKWASREHTSHIIVGSLIIVFVIDRPSLVTIGYICQEDNAYVLSELPLL